MNISSLSGCHVDEVPLIYKPFVCLFGYGIAMLGYLYCLIVHLTSKIVFINQQYLDGLPNHLICFWHRYVFIYFVTFLRHRWHAWMQHPVWFMKPSHIFLRLIGVRKVILGSTGHSGREAADQLVDYLRQGYSTAIMPDGPHGPPFVMKKGALYMSLQSHTPIVPIRFKCSRAWQIRHWDKRLWPLPFSKITVEYGRPVQITDDNLEIAAEMIAHAL